MAAAGFSPTSVPPRHVSVELPITVGQFVKVAGWVCSGGDAKQLVAAGGVRVNDEVETRRGRKLNLGDVVDVQGRLAVVVAWPSGNDPHAAAPLGQGARAAAAKEGPQPAQTQG